jgi:hypothetical protein
MVRPIATNHKLDNMRKGKERTEDGIHGGKTKLGIGEIGNIVVDEERG